VEDLEVMPGNPSFWSDRRVLVTGATGILGSWLIAELLERGAAVTAFVLDADPQSELLRSGNIQRVGVINGRLENLADMERAMDLHEVETVFHLGAQTIVPAAQRNPLATFEANVRGSYNLLEACRRRTGLVKQIVIASSDKAYGEQPELPYTEEMPLLGRNPYDASKVCLEHLAQSYCHSYELPVSIARCGNIYGGGDLNWSRIVPGTMRSLIRGERPIIRSDGKFLRDYVYVKDAARAYLCLAEKTSVGENRGEAYNFGPGAPVTVLDLVGRMCRLFGAAEVNPEIANTAAGEIRNQYLRADKARVRLGWQCEYDLDAGLTETMGWYRKFFCGTSK